MLGVEPRLSRPQREVLTTRRHWQLIELIRLNNEMWLFQEKKLWMEIKINSEFLVSDYYDYEKKICLVKEVSSNAIYFKWMIHQIIQALSFDLRSFSFSFFWRRFEAISWLNPRSLATFLRINLKFNPIHRYCSY